MATTFLSPTRALRRPRRLDLRAVVGMFLLLVATGGSVAFWSTSTDTRAVVVVRRDLPTGATLADADLAVARVRIDDGMYAAALPAEALSELVGKQLAEPVHAQQLLVRAQLSTRPPLGPDQLALTIPVSPETAAGGRVRPGDVVQVLATTDKSKPESRTAVVLPRAIVYDIGRDDRTTVINPATSLDGERPAARGPISSVTLIVTQEQALQLARARWNGELDVALLAPEATAKS